MFCLYCGLQADAEYIWKHMEHCKDNPNNILRELHTIAAVSSKELALTGARIKRKKHIKQRAGKQKVRIIAIQNQPVADAYKVRFANRRTQASAQNHEQVEKAEPASIDALKELKELAQKGFSL